MNLTIPKETMDKVVNLLASRPYIEVQALMQELQTNVKFVEEKPEEEKPAPEAERKVGAKRRPR